MAPDHSSSSAPTSASTQEELQTHSHFQLPFSHNNAPSPKMLPPPPSGWRRTMPRSRKPMAPDDSSSSPQFQLPYFQRMLLLLLLPPPPPPASTANSIPGWRTTMPRSRKPMAMATTCHILQSLGMEQDSHTGQDLPQELTDPVSVFLPHVTRTITQHLLQFADNNSDCITSESVSSNDEEAGPAVNSLLQKRPKRLIFAQVPPGDDDPDYGIWVAPPPGYFKLNVAVTPCNVEGVDAFGMGAVIRDHSAAARAAITLLLYDINPAQAESFICNLGIAFSLYWGFKSLIAETESHLLVDHFQAHAHTPGLHFSNFNYFYARPVSRGANGAAQVFAGIAHLRRRNIFWTAEDIRNYFVSNVMRF